MAEEKTIADHYLERYRKTIRFANLALAISLVLLLVNWLFAVEPGYHAIIHSNKLYKSQLKEAEKKLVAYQERLDRFYTRYNNDSLTNQKNLVQIDTLKRQLQKASYDTLATMKLDSLQNIVRFYEYDSVNRSQLQLQITLYGDSIKRIKDKSQQLHSLKTASLNENLKDYDWKSLVRFIFIVASNPKDGSLYLIGLITFMMVFAFVVRWVTLHYLARSIRLYKNMTGGLPDHNDLAIPAPFWLAPVPLNKKLDPKEGKTAETRVKQEEISRVLDFFSLKSKPTIFTACLILVLLILQVRLFYICIYSNTPDRFDLIFWLSVIFFFLTFFVACIWFYPIRVDDHYNAEPAENNLSRRAFVGLTGTALLSWVLLGNTNRFARMFGLNAKRFIRKDSKDGFRKSIDLEEGLYYRTPHPQNPDRVKYLYFVDGNHYSITLEDMRSAEEVSSFQKHLVPVSAHENILNPAFDFSYKRHSWHLERYTLYLLNQSKDKKAVSDFLLKTVMSGRYILPGDYRLQDLTAILCIRYGSESDVRSMVDYFDPPTSVDGDSEDNFYFRTIRYVDKELMKKISKWRNPHWIRKIKEKKYVSWDGQRI
jgi:hypothetical protein